MKVTYYFRSYRKGVFSIEVLFSRLMVSLGNRVIARCRQVGLLSILNEWLTRLVSPSDVYHITGDVNYIALSLRGSRTVLTVHDIGHYTNTLKGWRKKVYKKLWFDWPLHKVAMITVISEFSKQQLISIFSIDSSKIKVIHNPFPASYKQSDKRILSACPKIMQIGSGTHKNLSRLIAAIKDIRCELMLVRAYDKSLDELLKQQGIAATWFFNLSDKAMYELYEACDIVFFASTYEGFGMPILEAQAIGRAVITSNAASMPEVAGDGAVLVDPYQVIEIREAIVKLISDDNYRNDCIEKGYNNLNRFHPDFIALEYLNLYTQLISKQ
jgi:glycosyltransferase involved in cell wall biosynthesis